MTSRPLAACDPARTRRRVLVIAAAVAAVALAAAGTLLAARRPNHACRGAEVALVGVWDPARKAALHDAFLATKMPYAEHAWETVEKKLDAYTAAWVAMHQDACEASSVRQVQSAEVMDRRMICLGARLGEVRAVTDLFARADAKVVENATAAAGSLASLDGCADVAALMAPVAPPRDEVARAKVAAARDQVARAKALEKAGKPMEGLEVAKTAVEAARAAGYRPVEAEALLELGFLQEGDPKAAEQTLIEAFEAATEP